MRCRPPKRRKFSNSKPAVTVESTVEPLHISICSENLPEPLFLLERLPHIRTFCLSLRGDDGARLEHAEAVVEGSSVTINCQLVSDLDASLCCLRLDVGEELDERPNAASLAMMDGMAYARLPLAPETPPPAAEPVANGTAEARAATLASKANLPFAIKWGKGAGTGQWQQPIPCPPPERVFLDAEKRCLREEVGMYSRAATQRRRERSTLAEAGLVCRRCASAAMSSHGPPPAPLHRVTGARTLPDADLSQLADFMQCCNEIGFDWRCVFPPGGGDGEHADATANFAAKLDSGMCLAAEEDEDDEVTAVESSAASYDGGGASSSTCYLGTHSLHLAGAAPLLFPLCYPSDSFDEPPCYRHATSESGGGRWAPMRCPTCDATLGALRIGDQEKVVEVVEPVEEALAASTVPMWFDESAPPELRCTVQLLKGAVSVAEEIGEEEEEVFGGYSMAALVADRILRAQEGDEEGKGGGKRVSRFAVTPAGGGVPSALIVLLSPYVTLATNGFRFGAAAAGATTDALKVLFTTDAETIAQQLETGGPVARLVLPERDERDEVVKALHASTQLVPAAARNVGALRVGFMPVAPTWE